jgi:hypothetical protein
MNVFRPGRSERLMKSTVPVAVRGDAITVSGVLSLFFISLQQRMLKRSNSASKRHSQFLIDRINIEKSFFARAMILPKGRWLLVL